MAKAEVVGIHRADLKVGDVITLSPTLILVYSHTHKDKEGPKLLRRKFELMLDTNVCTFIWTDKTRRHREKEVDLEVPKSKWKNHYWLVVESTDCGESYNGGIWKSRKIVLERIYKSGKRYDPESQIRLTARQKWWRKSLDYNFTLVGRMRPTFGPLVKR